MKSSVKLLLVSIFAVALLLSPNVSFAHVDETGDIALDCFANNVGSDLSVLAEDIEVDWCYRSFEFEELTESRGDKFAISAYVIDRESGGVICSGSTSTDDFGGIDANCGSEGEQNERHLLDCSEAVTADETPHACSFDDFDLENERGLADIIDPEVLGGCETTIENEQLEYDLIVGVKAVHRGKDGSNGNKNNPGGGRGQAHNKVEVQCID